MNRARRFLKDTDGAAYIEFAAIASAFFLILFGMIEFANILRQWNQASRAAAWGARLAAVSDPVSSDLKTMTGLSSTVLPGDPMPAFTRACSGSTAKCSDGGTYSSAAMNAIVYGRGDAACLLTQSPNLGMCDIFDRIRPANVAVRYEQTGLGFAGRPGGPVPTITVTLSGLQFEFLFLGGLIGPVDIPPFTTTVTGEDLAKGI